MDNAHTFARYWSGQVPFIASFVLQQLRLYVAQNVWFNGHDQSRWFDVPVEALEQLQAGYQQQWADLGQQLLTCQPFAFNDRRFASAFVTLLNKRSPQVPRVIFC